MKKSCQFILLTLFCTYIQAILPISSRATVIVKDQKDNMVYTELNKTKFSKDSEYLISQNNRLGCVANGRRTRLSSWSPPLYNLVSTAQGVIQSDLTESQCQKAAATLREIQVNGIACVANGRRTRLSSWSPPLYNLVSTQGVIQSDLTESQCQEAVESF